MPKEFMVLDHKENYSTMDDFYIGVSVDEDGKEGLIAVGKTEAFHTVINPMVGGTPQDKMAVMEAGNSISKQLRRKVRIIRFSQREILKEFTP